MGGEAAPEPSAGQNAAIEVEVEAGDGRGRIAAIAGTPHPWRHVTCIAECAITPSNRPQAMGLGRSEVHR